MSKREEMVVTVDPEGATTIDVQGGKGRDCLEQSRFMEYALGGEVDKRCCKAEFYQVMSRIITENYLR